ncbi:MAG: chemotaxis response regulator protein-glutamate methylesterase [Halobacteriovoraceae bacterium]|nr:chemotaxis response regulator protein-glutamate methylesterase [Halobacteriovoraceae bacterium]|tara:strand:- start:1273 stop:2658 length:1386 start_codon:yes stop_codon:yes gene_type:complete
MSIKKLSSNSQSEVRISLDQSSGVLLLLLEDNKRECFLLRSPTLDECKKLLKLKDVKNARYVGSEVCLRLLKATGAGWTNFEREVVDNGAGSVIYCPSSGKVKIKKLERENIEVERPVPTKKKKVLIVDDSSTIQKLLTKIINSSEFLEVAGVADRPSAAKEFIEKEAPDLVTLDIHMPEMNGVEFLKQYLGDKNLPVVVVSSVSVAEGPLVMEALSNGALSYVQKPSLDKVSTLAGDILNQLEAIASKNTSGTKKQTTSISVQDFITTDGLVAIGSSTGGTSALQEILTSLPKEIPPIVIVQHIPAVFSKALAERLDSLCPFHVKEAEDGDKIAKNTVYIAPGGFQMKVAKHGSIKKIILTDDPPVNRFKPSVDYLFNSIPSLKETNVVASILTGMGKDGAKGLLTLKESGYVTLAQDEESCVVFGMPREALKIGAAELAVPLSNMSKVIVQKMNKTSHS